jgi:uncharacterized protein
VHSELAEQDAVHELRQDPGVQRVRSGPHAADEPLLVIAGTAAGSPWQHRELHEKARPRKELFLIDGASRMDYAGPHVGLAREQLAPFFLRNL